MVNNEVASVIVASAQSVAKVFVIGAVGFLAVRWPKRAPLLPASAVSVVARFTFHVLLLSLFYSTAAVSVSPDTIGQYWFVVVAGFVVLGVSYLVSTVLGKYVPGLHPQDFVALRVAATFPNIVALPILIFPSLCEYEVVYKNFAGSNSSNSSSSSSGGDAAAAAAAAATSTNEDDEILDPLQLSQQCANDANAMIFCYFFTWSLLFWSLGYPQLLAAAKQRLSLPRNRPSFEQDEKGVESAADAKNNYANEKQVLDDIEEGKPDELSMVEEVTATEACSNTNEETSSSVLGDGDNTNLSANDCSSKDAPPSPSLVQNIMYALRQTLTSPGFLALALGVITGCIAPLRDALFEPGGPLRFLGDAIETLGRASSSMSTMVVAASLVPPQNTLTAADDGSGSNHSANATDENTHREEGRKDEQIQALPAENPIMSDPNFGPHHGPCQRRRRNSSLYRLSDSMRRSSANLIAHVKQVRSTPEQRRLLVWFTLSRLVISPMIIVGILIGLNRGTTLLDSVPPLSQLVVIVNASLPGALIVVVLLKSQPSLSESASAVARVYLPTYLISIVTIAAWTAVGLWTTMPSSQK